MTSPEWVLYVKRGCPWCIDAIDYLGKRGYAYREVDVRADAAAYQRMQDLSGQGLTPTLVIGDDLLLADFDTRQLEQFLTEKGLAKAS